MTDNEIMQALKCCSVFDCDSCPLCSYGDTSVVCSGYLYGEIIDLINRQRAEIERLKEENKKLNLMVESIDDYMNPLPFKTDFDNAIETAKSEAVKEFVERLKKVWFDIGYESPDVDFEDFIDNLVKGMVGDSNG